MFIRVAQVPDIIVIAINVNITNIPPHLLLLQLHQMPEQPEIWTSSTLHKRDTKVKRKDWPLWRMWKQLWVNFLFGVFTTIDADMFDTDTARRERCEITPTLEESLYRHNFNLHELTLICLTLTLLSVKSE